jgi:hypothetical protein
VVIVTPVASDARLAATRDAIAFWNRTFSDLKLRQPLVEADVHVGAPMSRAFEAYTRDVWRLAGKSVPRTAYPIPPAALVDLDTDIVIFFSSQRIYSFAWPFGDGDSRFFLAIQNDAVPPLTYANVTRNVIAHELGHTLGLRHNGFTPTLMCGPCETLLYWSARPMFFPLTRKDRARLQMLHPGDP